MSVGTLTAERDGPHIKFTIDYADPDFDHFMVERFEGYRIDEIGNQVEVWTPIRGGAAKYVCGDTTHERSREYDEDEEPVPLQGPRTYRALVYRRVQDPGTQVRVLHTEGIYSAPVTIE